jgi:predicted Rossmann fold flavoprotein
MTTDLIIIGAGAAGLMAACRAGEAGLNCLLLERRHRPGLKLLMCGNNRCNLSHSGNALSLMRDYGEPVGVFLETALQECPPAVLRKWFSNCGLETVVQRNRIYPRSGKADDVLYCFTDRLRDLEVPLMLNCPAQKISPITGGYEVSCGKVCLRSRFVLLATGGVSYPKTGSVGDGQRMAGELGLRLEPYRPGLAGIEVSDTWLQNRSAREEAGIPSVRVHIFSQGREIAATEGNLLAAGNCLRGSAIFDATRILGRREISNFSLRLDLFPEHTPAVLEQRLLAAWRKTGQAAATLNAVELDHTFAAGLSQKLQSAFQASDFAGLAAALKAMALTNPVIRPLKEAIVTIGGVALDEIDRENMQSRKLPGLFFAGEVMDVDGPTGGYNLHAAFASARLAIQAIAEKSQTGTSKQKRVGQTTSGAKKQSGNRKAAWGKKFWDGYLR